MTNPPNPPNASPQSLRAVREMFPDIAVHADETAALEAKGQPQPFSTSRATLVLRAQLIDAEFAPLLAAAAEADAAFKHWLDERGKPEAVSSFFEAMRHLAQVAHPHATATGGEKDARAEAEAAGYDSGKNGADKANCHHRHFATQATLAAWERGKKRAEEEKAP